MKYFTREPKIGFMASETEPQILSHSNNCTQRKESSTLKQARVHFHSVASPNRRLGSIAEALSQFSVMLSLWEFYKTNFGRRVFLINFYQIPS